MAGRLATVAAKVAALGEPFVFMHLADVSAAVTVLIQHCCSTTGQVRSGGPSGE